MRRLMMMAMIALLAIAAEAKEARLVTERKCPREACMSEWTPFALTICGPVGLPWGDWEIKGLQIGVFNSVYRMTGLQIGVVNIADQARGFQIGVVNVISTDDCPFLPILNWSF